jgi:hypothetical protein
VRRWTLAEATAALPEVKVVVRRIRELVAAARARQARRGAAPSGNGQSPAGAGDAELRDALAQLTDQGIIVRDPGRGLIDFPAVSPSGREYLLCWVDGEDTIEWWHWPEDGFAGRTPLSEPPT